MSSFTALRNAARAVVGLPIMAVQHLARVRHLERTQREVTSLSESAPMPVTAGGDDDLQTRFDGVGPLLMRTYSVEIVEATMTAAELMDRFRDDPNQFCPQHLAGFHAPTGETSRQLRDGEEVLVELPGPWNGPLLVRIESPTETVLATRDGHMEAGQIRFRTSDDGDHLTFVIRSWARAGDRWFRQLHVDTPIAREVQTAMWAHTCDRAVKMAGGSRRGPVRAETEVLANSDIGDDHARG